MEEKELLNQLKGLLEEKYEPILVVQLLRVPPQAVGSIVEEDGEN